MDCWHEWLTPEHNRTVCKKCGRDGWISLDTQSGHKDTHSGQEETTPQASPVDMLWIKKNIGTAIQDLSEGINGMVRGFDKIAERDIRAGQARLREIYHHLDLTLTTESVSREIEKPQENCPTRDECADMYRDLGKARKKIAYLEQRDREYGEEIDKQVKENAELEKKIDQLENENVYCVRRMQALENENERLKKNLADAVWG